MKLIVVGTDGSPSSMTAVATAAELAAGTKAELHIVCVATLARDLALRSFAPLSIPDDYDQEAEDAADAAVKRAAQVAIDAGAKVVTHVRDGDASTELLAACEELHADLLVVGSHGMTGAGRFLLGSVPNRCTHHATCSVLVARSA